MSPFDNALAIDQIEVAYSTLLNRPPARSEKDQEALPATRLLAQDGKEHPRIVRYVASFRLDSSVLSGDRTGTNSLNKPHFLILSTFHLLMHITVLGVTTPLCVGASLRYIDRMSLTCLYTPQSFMLRPVFASFFHSGSSHPSFLASGLRPDFGYPL